MLKFIRGHHGSGASIHQTKNVQERLRKEKLFSYSQINTYGFPNKPSTLSYDETLGLLAVGCSDGSLYLYGQPGVQLSGRHVPDGNQQPGVQTIVFLPSRLEILTLTQPNSLHLWSITQSKLEHKKSLHLASKLKKITAVAVLDEIAFIGTEGGNVYRLNLNSFELLESETIRVDVILQSAPESCKVNPGTVEVLLMQGKRLFVGYQKGLVIEWEQNVPPKFQLTTGQLEDLTVHNGVLVTAHGDGSYMIAGKATTPYGPYPCKRISRVRLMDELIIFAGGMPRSSGDHNTVSVIRESSSNNDPKKQEHIAFDLTSKVIEFCIAKDSLLILTEEELVAIDLRTGGWPMYKNPYLNCIHPSAITCFTCAQGQLDGVKEDSYSKNKWPIEGGNCDPSDNISSIILLTGHEDGSVRFWSANGGYMELLRVFSTFPLFDARGDGDQRLDKDAEEEEWPPFRKVGFYDPFTDDPRLAVKKLVYCPESSLLFIGGTAGQVVILDVNRTTQQLCKVTKCNLITQESSFVWKGHEALDTCSEVKASSLLQVHPPASITALAVEPACEILTVGTAHGFLLYNYKKKTLLMYKSTLSPNDYLASGDTPISRRKSIKKSLRESFRRLRKGRSPTPGQNTIVLSKTNERAIEARSANDEAFSSMVRCLTISKTFVLNSHTASWTLWVGLNRGLVQVYILSNTGEATLAKEIHLRHGAPILDIIIIDSANKPVATTAPLSKSVDTQQQQQQQQLSHKVLICSEEQLKLFTLPSLRPYGKLKLTALEGCKLRKITVAKFSEDPKDYYLLCLANTGDVSIVSMPDLRRFYMVNCLKREDISGISSFSPTPSAEAVYLKSSSELQRVSFSQSCIRHPCGLFPDQPAENHEKIQQSTNIHDESTDDITLDSIRDLTQNMSVTEGQTTTVVTNRNGNGGSGTQPATTSEIIGNNTTAATTSAAVTSSLATVTTVSALLEVERAPIVLDSEV